MLRLGIIGSSYSSGSHKITNPLLDNVGENCEPINTWFEKHADVEVYNLAIPGRGSEEYHKAIIRAAKLGIDTVVLEMCSDRSQIVCRMPDSEDVYDDLLKYDCLDTDDLIKIATDPHELRKITKSIACYRDPSETDPVWDITIPGIKKEWLMPYVKFKVLEDMHSWNFWTLEKIYWTLELAEQLDINVLLWEYRKLKDTKLKESLGAMPSAHYLDIPQGAQEYYIREYGKKALSDGDHLSDECYEHLVKEWLIPGLKDAGWLNEKETIKE